MRTLQPHLAWHRARLFRGWDIRPFAALVLAVLRLRTVCLSVLAQTLNPRRNTATNADDPSAVRRLQRFFALFTLKQRDLTRLLLALRDEPGPLTLVLDRTEWKFGTKRFNLLLVGYQLENFVVPLRWTELDKAGSSSEAERMALLEPIVGLIEARRSEAVVADREFIGQDFFAWMKRHPLRFVIRIRTADGPSANAKLRDPRTGQAQRAEAVFASLPVGGRHRLRDRRFVYGHWLYVVAAREGDDPWMVVTNARPKQAITIYGHRWAVETTFAAFKSRGFDADTRSASEATHLRASDRIEKLIAVLALALVWAVKVGQWRSRARPLPVKKHGRRAVSLFRYGLDYLQQHLLAHNQQALRPAFQVLSCT